MDCHQRHLLLCMQRNPIIRLNELHGGSNVLIPLPGVRDPPSPVSSALSSTSFTMCCHLQYETNDNQWHPTAIQNLRLLCKFLPYLKGSREPGLWEIGTATVSQPQSRSPKMSGRSRPSTKTLVKNFPYSKTEEPKNELKAPASPVTHAVAPGLEICNGNWLEVWRCIMLHAGKHQ